MKKLKNIDRNYIFIVIFGLLALYLVVPENYIFGSNTERQTKNFQRDHQLTVDGKAGNKTKMAMFNLFFDANGRSTLGNYCSYLNDSQMAGTDEGYNPDQQ